MVSSLIIWVGGWSKLTFAVKIGLGDFFSFNLHLQTGVGRNRFVYRSFTQQAVSILDRSKLTFLIIDRIVNCLSIKVNSDVDDTPPKEIWRKSFNFALRKNA